MGCARRRVVLRFPDGILHFERTRSTGSILDFEFVGRRFRTVPFSSFAGGRVRLRNACLCRKLGQSITEETRRCDRRWLFCQERRALNTRLLGQGGDCLYLDEQVGVGQFRNRNGGSGRAVFGVKIRVVDRIVALEILHVHQESRNVDDVL